MDMSSSNAVDNTGMQALIYTNFEKKIWDQKRFPACVRISRK